MVCEAASFASGFDLSVCAAEAYVQSPLLAVLLVVGVLRSLLYTLLPTSDNVSPKSRLVLTVKLVLLVATVVLSATNLVLVRLRDVNVALIQTYILEPVALLSLIPLTSLNHTRTRRSSTIVLLFWPLYTVAQLIWTWSVVEKAMLQELNTVLIIKWCTLGVGLVGLVLECLGPEFDKDSKVSLLGEADKKELHVEHPLLTANVYSVWTFGWMTPLMRKGASAFITEDDLPSLPPKDESSNLGMQLEEQLKKHQLWKALFLAYGGTYAAAAMLKIVSDLLSYLQPQLLRWLLSYIAAYQSARKHDDNDWGVNSAQVRVGPWSLPESMRLWHTDEAPMPGAIEGFAIAGIMFAANLAQTILIHQYFQRVFETGMRVRAGLVSVIYSKSMLLSSSARTSKSTGDIVNLMAVDATRLQDFCTYGLMLVSAPFQIFIAFASLFDLLGWSAFVGVAIMIVSVPLNTLLSSFLKKMQEQQMKNRDQRTRLMNELLSNIKSIKLWAWEHTFLARILDLRNNKELKMMRKISYLTSFSITLWSGIPLLVAFASFAVAATVSSKPLTSDIIFPAISIFILLQFPLAMIAQVSVAFIEAMVSVRRLKDFLGSEELQEDARALIMQSEITEGEVVLKIAAGEFCWEKDVASPTLEDINLQVRKGQLTGILGRVGDGKTSLLGAIVGEMHRREGEVVVKGTVSYAPQEPWIQSASIRDNIVFGHVWDEDFYNLVLSSCALGPDIAIMAEGDQTVVGEKGITLSGGQRARVSLARAVYARADLVLLDDCLAAVDSHVAKHVFEHVIGPNGILATKARILVTNSIAFLKHFDQLVYLRRGIIIESGSYEALMDETDGLLSKLVKGHGTGTSSSSGTSTPAPEKSGFVTPQKNEDSSSGSNLSVIISEKLRHKGSFSRAVLAPLPPTRIPVETGITKEHAEQGRVKTTVYGAYIKASNPLYGLLFVLAIVLAQAASILSTFVLRAWSNHNEQKQDNDDAWYYLRLYGLVTLASVLLSGASAVMMWVLCGLTSAKFLHDTMLRSLLRAPLSYFEVTPTGRILNLFSRDTYVVDQLLARVIQNTFSTLARTIGIIAVIAISFPPFLVAVIPLGFFYLRVMKYYLATSRELKRFDAVTKSPIFAWFSESLAGISTIHAFNQKAIFKMQSQRRIDRNQICYLPSIAVNRWLGVRLELVGALLMLVVAVLAVSALITIGVDAGLVGLVLSYAASTTGSLNWLVRSASEVEQNIVSVERILHQIDVKPEAPDEVPDTKPSQEWPATGAIEFNNYSTRYRPELELVLKDINVTFAGAEKIGLIGRTGSGKSTFLLSLFRILEAAEGAILVDGVDIATIGLHDLRSVICIVPQSPDLFEGSLRENIDPVGTYPDSEIWIALERAHLKEFAEGLPEKLDAPVREGGSSLSAGQRQLLCFARALLRKSRILVLDEATSAVDLETDQNIQEVIRGEAFRDVTILTIAHRLNTIMDCDRVLVMDSGKVLELDSPKNLLANKDSMFYSLAESAGLSGNVGEEKKS